MTAGSPRERAADLPGADGVWTVSACADARAVLVSADARVPADVPPELPSGGVPAGDLVERGVRLRGLWMWGGADERRALRRKVAAAALGPAALEPLLPHLEARADALLDSGRAGDGIDLVAGFARPLLRDALMDLFGFPAAARAPLEAQVGAMAGFIPGHRTPGTARYFALAATASSVERLWAGPLPPLAAASRRLRDSARTGELSPDEALAQATLLLFGNSYTTLDALAGLIARLAESPDLWRAAQGGSPAVADLVEEGLRLGPPDHLVLFRDAVGEIVCPGMTIPAGARIVLPLAALNRDPACFAGPDAFDPGRAGPPHLAFGAGRHMCVGLHLARAVIRVGIGALLRRLAEWPADTRIRRAPGILGGLGVDSIALPASALRRC